MPHAAQCRAAAAAATADGRCDAAPDESRTRSQRTAAALLARAHGSVRRDAALAAAADASDAVRTTETATGGA
eukprot:1244383-Pleurochrysis_carterae.AAC.1